MAASFELRVSLPPQAHFAVTMRDLAAHAVRFAGGQQDDADRFGAAVERVVVACFERCAPGRPVPVILRRESGPVEFLIGCEQRFNAGAAHVSEFAVGWIHEAGTQMCRVAFDAAAL